eukprot:CAMPEP_0196588896 /NCGR_PEP_ID=MMETSP1081-20130531/62028_1 /TAXON_ID=36882 /ORGANISM="Pyramimonas amylifera, Strain CCMP720" /LENGTH=415 /DNA_ID=CAMNT_0041911529 /DNA_START=47 /DNA_END=1294 /DNA_ORIENTATION=+
MNFWFLAVVTLVKLTIGNALDSITPESEPLGPTRKLLVSSENIPSWHPHAKRRVHPGAEMEGDDVGALSVNMGADLDREPKAPVQKSSSVGLEAAVRKHLKNNTIILAFTNWGDCQTLFPDNLVHSLELVGLSNYLLIAIDEHAFQYLSCRGFNVFSDSQFFSGKAKQEHTGFQKDLNSAYHVIALKRFHLLEEVLEIGVNFIFTDTDVVFLKDPINYMVAASPPHDAMFLWDGRDALDGKTHLKGRGITGTGDIQSNAGFFFVRNTPTSKAWYASVKVMMDEEGELRARNKGRRNDQEIVSASLQPSHLAKQGVDLKWDLMPRNEFVNGWLIKNPHKDPAGCLATGSNPKKHTRTWYAIHMNYNKGFKKKLIQFKRCGIWFCEFCSQPIEANTCMVQVKNTAGAVVAGTMNDDK